ncbi:hypothetical protein HZS_7866 [Henneguya salminicola]|nr:hypothetical protein HZS_7866 [Henneguya salminicola]
MDAVKRKLDSLKQQHEAATTKLKKCEDEYKTLSEQLEDNKNQHHNVEEEFNEINHKIEDLEVQISEMQTQLWELDKLNLEFQMSSSYKNTGGASHKVSLITAVKHKLKEAKAKLGHLDKSLEDAESNIRSLESELCELEGERDEYDNAAKKDDLEFGRLSSEIKYKKFAKDKTNKRSITLASQNKILETRLSEEGAKNDCLTKKLAELEEETNQMEIKFADTNEAYGTMKTEWERTLLEIGSI